MTINTKLTESFRAQIKNIFKESADMVANAAPPAPMPPAPPAPVAPPTDPTLGAGPQVPQEEEQKVTLTVSLLKSLLDWVNGEEEPEEGTADGTGTDDGSAPMDTPPEETPPAPVNEQVATSKPKPVAPPKPMQMNPHANPTARSTGMGIKEEAPVAPPTDETTPPDETSPEGEEESGVDPMDIEALVNKVAELGQTKPLLTDEDFGEIVAAVDTSGGEDDLSGVLDDGAGDETTPPAPTATTPPMPVKEEIGRLQSVTNGNNGNKGIQSPTNKGKPV